LVGLEMYVKTRRKIKHGVEHVKEAETKVMHPEEYKRKMEEQRDKSKSAERERQILAYKAAKEEAERKEQSWRRRVWKRLGHVGHEKDELKMKQRDDAKEHKRNKWLSKPGQDVESAIPPDGRRDELEKRDGAAT
jgi:hypothetical protein